MSSLEQAEPMAAVPPRLRGALHQVGVVFVTVLDGRRLGASALDHRTTLSSRMGPRRRRVDHAGIYLLIARQCVAIAFFEVRVA